MSLLTFKRILLSAVCFSLLLLLLVFPQKISAGIAKGLIACANVLIPSLFPFSVVAIFTAKSGLLSCGIKGKFSYYFILFLLSALGGYPIGAKVLAEEFSQGKINKADAEKALCFCVNAGPSFVISFVGYSVFSSRKLGIILLSCHLLASFTVFLFMLPSLNAPLVSVKKHEKIKVSECFVKSVGEACASMTVICGYALLFAGINSLFEYDFLIFKVLNLSLEITNAMTFVKNIYLASFLLGFSGISIICQILSLTEIFQKNAAKLLLFRVIHGFISLVYSFLFLKIFKTDIAVFSNVSSRPLVFSVSNTVISGLVIFCGICLISSLQNKKPYGKLIGNLLQ